MTPAPPEQGTAARPVRVVLVKPEQPRNVGAVVRAAANFGAEGVYLVAPTDWNHEADRAARVASSGAWGVIGGVHLVATLAEATADCHLIAGTSARTRDHPGEPLTPAEFFTTVAPHNAAERLALVLGPESQGLSSADLALCHVHLRIPTCSTFSSLNLGHAAAVLLYEAQRQLPDAATAAPYEEGADVAQQERWLSRITAALSGGGPPHDLRQVAQLRRLLARARPAQGDIALLHNLLKRLSHRDR